MIFPLLKTNQIGFSCTSAFSRGLIYSNHSLIPSQHHHNLYGMELPSQISFSLLWSYAKNYCLVTTVSVGLVSPANSRKVYYSHTSSHTRLRQVLKPFFHRWRERARDVQSLGRCWGVFWPPALCCGLQLGSSTCHVRQTWAPKLWVKQLSLIWHLSLQFKPMSPLAAP